MTTSRHLQSAHSWSEGQQQGPRGPPAAASTAACSVWSVERQNPLMLTNMGAERICSSCCVYSLGDRLSKAKAFVLVCVFFQIHHIVWMLLHKWWSREVDVFMALFVGHVGHEC